MKKIVALVLSLVMVLGLATTAFAAPKTTTYSNMFVKNTDGTDLVSDAAVTYTEAVPVEFDENGVMTPGQIAYYTIESIGGKNYVQVGSVAEADVVVYKDAAYKNQFLCLKETESIVYMGNATVFANFGKACGQVNFGGYDKTATYYVADSKLYVADSTAYIANAIVTVGGADVAVVLVETVKSVTNAHVPVATIKNGKPVAVECSKCGLAAVEAANVLSLPEKADVVDGYTTWYWPAASAPAASDKVESAQTFDAGIAMYVGMSVMAAAGSAVVLKKKD